MFKIQNIIAAINLQNIQVLKRTEECWNLVVRLNGKLVCPFQPQYQQTNSPDWSPHISLKHSWENLLKDQRIFPDHFMNSHNLSFQLSIDVIRRKSMSASTSFKLVQHKSPPCKTNKDRIRCKERKILSCPLYMYHQACQDSLYRN